MMTMEQVHPFWTRVVEAVGNEEKEAVFEHLLKTQHPELNITHKQQLLNNCDILTYYLSRFERLLYSGEEIRVRDTIETCTNFLRIWIIELLAIFLEDNNNDASMADAYMDN